MSRAVRHSAHAPQRPASPVRIPSSRFDKRHARQSNTISRPSPHKRDKTQAFVSVHSCEDREKAVSEYGHKSPLPEQRAARRTKHAGLAAEPRPDMYGAALRASKLRRFQPNRRNGPPVPRTAAANRRIFPKNRNSRIATVIHEAPGHTPACFRPTAGPGSAKGTTGPRPGARNGRQRARRDQAEKQGREHPAEGTEQERTKHKDETGSAKRQKTKRKTGMTLTDTAAVRPFMQTRRPRLHVPGKGGNYRENNDIGCPAAAVPRPAHPSIFGPSLRSPPLRLPSLRLLRIHFANPAANGLKRPSMYERSVLRLFGNSRLNARLKSERLRRSRSSGRNRGGCPRGDSNGSRAAAEARRTPPHRTRFERSMTDFRRAEDSGFSDGLQAISETPSKPLSTVVAFSVRASPFGQGLMPESRSNGIAYRPQFPESGEPCRSLLTNRRSFHPRPLPAFVAFRFYPRIGAAVHKAPGTAFAATKT